MTDFLYTPLGDCSFSANIDVQATARAAAFFGSYLPSFLAVIFFSTPRLRQQWAFWFLVAAMALSVGKGILDMELLKLDASQLDRFGPQWLILSSTTHYANYFVLWTVPWICDCALLCKLLAFHQAQSTPWRKRAAVIAFPLSMHIPRVPLLVASCVLFLVGPFEASGSNGAPPFLFITAYKLLAVEGALQVAQNCYCSGFLLYKAHQFAQADYAASNQRAQRARLGLRYFTESILFTFLPASVLQVGWLVVALISIWVFDNDGRLQRGDTYFRMFNVMFSINFGLLAVWWSTPRIHALEVGQSGSQLGSGAAEKPASTRDMSLVDWTIGPIEAEDNETRVNELDQNDELTSVPEHENEDEKEEDSLRRRRHDNAP